MTAPSFQAVEISHGGHVDADETPIDALLREVEDETGWCVQRIVAELGETTWTGSDGSTAASSITWSRSMAILTRHG